MFNDSMERLLIVQWSVLLRVESVVVTFTENQKKVSVRSFVRVRSSVSTGES